MSYQPKKRRKTRCDKRTAQYAKSSRWNMDSTKTMKIKKNEKKKLFSFSLLQFS